MIAAPPETDAGTVYPQERMDTHLAAIEFEGTPKPYAPFGVVLLPSPELDRIDSRWLDWVRNNRQSSIAVNLAFLSKRLRDTDSMPGHVVWLDSPMVWGKRFLDRNAYIKLYQFNEACRLWSGYLPGFCDEFVRQSRHELSSGQRWPAWCKEDRVEPDKGGVRTVAGQYTSCAAVNILAYLLGWNCTIFVVGNLGRGGYCDLCLDVEPKWWAENVENRTRISFADHTQWGWLRHQARTESNVEIIHVGNSPANTVPRMTEADALGVLYGNQ